MSRRRGLVRALAFAVATSAGVLLAGCAGGPERPKPQPLPPLTASIGAHALWSQRLSPVQFPLTVAVNEGIYTVAASDGSVAAIEAASGQQLWRAQVGAALAAGVGSDGRSSAVVTRGGELVVLRAGAVAWRKPLATRVATAPLVAGGRVFVLGVDRSLQAFDATDGAKLWALQRPGDPLTLAQSGVILPFGNALIVGQGPRLAAVDPGNGSVGWEVPLAAPRGANEVERLADLVGPALRVGDSVCARAFQAAVGCVDVTQGRLVWSRNGGGIEAVGGDTAYVFGADASDRMTAWRIGNGDVAWTSDALLYRGLSAPASIGASVVYGDSQGLVHWLARDSGVAQLRLPTDGSAVAAPPAVSGSTLLIVTRAGGLYAFDSR